MGRRHRPALRAGRRRRPHDGAGHRGHRRDTCYVADLAVPCAPREPGRRMVAEPVLVVQVLSPSTSQVDQWRKVADYRTLPSVQEIVVAFSDERRVEVQRRTADGWRVEDLIGQALLVLACCDSPVPLDALYAGFVDPRAAPET